MSLLSLAKGMAGAYRFPDRGMPYRWAIKDYHETNLVRAVSCREGISTKTVVFVVGTETARHWLGNFNISYVDVPRSGVRVHHGFYNAWCDLRDFLAHQEADYHVGHSRGGAIVHCHHVLRPHETAYPVTFAPARSVLGCPPHIKGLNIVNRDDKIPHMPPWPYKVPGTDIALPWEPFDWSEDHRMKRIIPALERSGWGRVRVSSVRPAMS